MDNLPVAEIEAQGKKYMKEKAIAENQKRVVSVDTKKPKFKLPENKGGY